MELKYKNGLYGLSKPISEVKNASKVMLYSELINVGIY
jgi:hypothetical protein